MTLPLKCHECGIEKGWPCSFLDPNYDGQHGDRKAELCALEQAYEKGLVPALVPKESLTGGPSARTCPDADRTFSAQDADYVCNLLRYSKTDPDTWTRQERRAVSRLHALREPNE